MKFALSELEKRIQLGLIAKNKHPEWPYYIYNYTPECTFRSKNWDYYTRWSRGLVLDEEGNGVALPFKKFFNLNEVEETMFSNLPDEMPEVSEKLDGFLCIQFPGPDGKYYLTTRGVFTSPHAQLANRFFHEKYSDKFRLFDSDYTYLYEGIFPESPIVVDYKDFSGLVVVGMVNKHSGYDLPYREVAEEGKRLGIPTPRLFSMTLDEILKEVEVSTGIEGWVLRYPNGLRVKVKTDHYAQVHRILVGLSTRSIWEALSQGREVRIPPSARDDLRDSVDNEVQSLKSSFVELDRLAKGIFSNRPPGQDRKTLALYFDAQAKGDSLLKAALFMMLDGKDYTQPLWKKLEPKASRSLSKVSLEEV